MPARSSIVSPLYAACGFAKVRAQACAFAPVAR
jgi:hypothetical protein